MKRLIVCFLIVILSFPTNVFGRSFRPFVGGHTVTINGKKKQTQIDLPVKLHLRNTAGSDGLGLCVFASLSHTFRWHGLDKHAEIFTWMQSRPGGGYPTKVDSMIQEFCLKDRGLEKPPYLHYFGADLNVLKFLLDKHLLVSVTYSGRDGVFYRGPIAHMVNVVYADDEAVAILDNNFPGQYLWMDSSDFVFRWRENSYGGWSVIVLRPPVPPAPVNADYAGDNDTNKTNVEQVFSEFPMDDTRRFIWLEDHRTPNQVNLFDMTTNVQIGAMDKRTGVYRHYDRFNNAWSGPDEPPVPFSRIGIPISGCMERGVCPNNAPQRSFNFGLIEERTGVSANIYRSFDDFLKMPYLYNKDTVHLTWVGNAPKEFYDLLRELQEHNVVGAVYPEGHWAVEQFPLGLIAQQAYTNNTGWGKVIFRAEVVPTAEQVLGIIRRWREGYNPLKDVVIRKIVEQKVKEVPSYTFINILNIILIVVMFVFLVFVVRKKK